MQKSATGMWKMLWTMAVMPFGCTWALPAGVADMAADYFVHKHVTMLCYMSCEGGFQNNYLVKHLLKNNLRASVKQIDEHPGSLKKLLQHWNVPIGVVLDGACSNAQLVLNEASKQTQFDAMHIWLVLMDPIDDNDTMKLIDDNFQHLNLSLDADIVVASNDGDRYELTDIFNFGRIQGNKLERNLVGTWRRSSGLNISLNRFTLYDRWDFHNLTLRAVTVVLDSPETFDPRMLSDPRYTPGISAMTKIVAQLMEVLKQQHNFRFNYTVAGRWVGSPEKNSTLAVTNSMHWGEQDVSCTCLRIFPKWLQWMDPFFPPATKLETKFYYLIPDRGVGGYENRFLTPMSAGVWVCACAAGGACALVLAVAAAVETRPQPVVYAIGSVLAAASQQAYEDGVQMMENALSSQGRRMAMLVLGMTSMVLYNFYTSSVVSWLLNAAPPSIATFDDLIKSDLELIFEDIGYTRGWLDNPGFYYYSGFVNPKEDELREKKVTNGKRTKAVLQSVKDGVELVRSGAYAYHSEPYTASQVISRRFEDLELCELGALQMMRPAPVYIVGQKNSPFKQFFTWSLMRLLERGHVQAARARIVAGGRVPACSGRSPRALALGQAAPAFVLLAQAALLAVLILGIERIWWGRRVEDIQRRRRR